MAQLPLVDLKLRMVRRGVKKRRFRFEHVRNVARTDAAYFAWLVENEFFAVVGDGWYAVTQRGRAAHESGLYET